MLLEASYFKIGQIGLARQISLAGQVGLVKQIGLTFF
jgi:hypothetical protein